MEKKKSFPQALENFFAGKGFYIVLFLCVAVIGVSAWTMLAGDLGDSMEDDALTAAAVESAAPSGELLPASVQEEAPEIVEVAPVVNMEPQAPLQETGATHSPDGNAPKADTVPGYFIRPVAGELENPHSMDALRYNRTMQDWRTHDGIDIAAELGAQVKAVADGMVEKIYTDDAMGTTVVILHSGDLRSIYCNLAENPTVVVGDAVATGSVIGSVGSTALSETGEVNHLHFAMSLKGGSVNPEDYLP